MADEQLESTHADRPILWSKVREPERKILWRKFVGAERRRRVCGVAVKIVQELGIRSLHRRDVLPVAEAGRVIQFVWHGRYDASTLFAQPPMEFVSTLQVEVETAGLQGGYEIEDADDAML